MTTYILMPFQFGKSGKPIHQIALIHQGRGSILLAAANELERKLNQGKTAAEARQAAFDAARSGDITDKQKNEIIDEIYSVVPDTCRAWRDYVGSQNWPAMIRAEQLL